MFAPRFRSAAARALRHGFTQWEALALILALGILAALGTGPIMAYAKKNSLAHAVESARTISIVLAQYATDNNGVYPVGEGTPVLGTSEGIARNLLQNNYAPDATLFSVGSTPSYHGAARDYADLAAANLSWDFTAGPNASTGLTANAPGTLPLVYTTGEKVAFPSGGAIEAQLSGHGPFGTRGMVVAYKADNAVFLPRRTTGDGFNSALILAPTRQDTGTYTQIRP